MVAKVWYKDRKEPARWLFDSAEWSRMIQGEFCVVNY